MEDVESILAAHASKRRERLKLERQASVLEAEEKTLLDSLSKLKPASGMYGPYVLTVEKKIVPKVNDWGKFIPYLLRTGNLDMLQRRLTESAVMARLKNNEPIDGVDTDEKTVYKVEAA